MNWHAIQDWVLALGQEYGVNPVVFAVIYFGGIPFLVLSIAWVIRNRKRSRPVHFPLLSAGGFWISAYMYVVVAGENIPLWVYGILVIFALTGGWKMLQLAMNRSAA